MKVSRKEFDRMLEEAIDALPEEFARWLEEVPVVVEDRPRCDEGGEDPLGLFVGDSRLESGEGSGGLPAQIMIYRVPLMETCTSLEQLAEEIRKTLLHELGHYAGMDEEELERRGYGPPDEDEDIEWDVEE